MNRSILLLISGAIACTPGMYPEEIPASEGTVSYPDLPALDAAITEEMSASNVPGLSACIIKDGETAWCSGYGYANLKTDLPATPTTPFMLASVSKTFAGVALMHLIETGALGLDDPINEHLGFEVIHPDERNTEITARMLLSHTSGIADNWDVIDQMVVDGDSSVSLGDFMEGYLTSGGQWYDSYDNFLPEGVKGVSEYSNIGASLAAYLVEAVSGQPFDDYCDQNIFVPLQMEQTGWHLADFDESTVAVPYEWYSNDWHGLAHYGYPDYPDGSLRTGAEQLSRFLAMFANGGALGETRILSSDTVAEMQQAHYPNLDDTQGLIWYDWSLDGRTVTGHNGGDYGASTEMGFTADGVGFVVLMNGEGRNRTLENIEEAMLEAAQSL
ncbi:MAG: CubicO group peptidase (beta-lactamase class C family) [Myxococcota bacterium]|jgi:CubicO group peptidase (beta-lactamase class C family)